MNQAIEQAIIDHTNKVWEQALKVGIADERKRIIDLLDENSQGEYKQIMLTPKLIATIKGETN